MSCYHGLIPLMPLSGMWPDDHAYAVEQAEFGGLAGGKTERNCRTLMSRIVGVNRVTGDCSKRVPVTISNQDI